ncbi:hypothetical protein GEMRC1_004069 [Eukaryota sp. GEM-RC1]
MFLGFSSGLVTCLQGTTETLDFSQLSTVKISGFTFLHHFNILLAIDANHDLYSLVTQNDSLFLYYQVSLNSLPQVKSDVSTVQLFSDSDLCDPNPCILALINSNHLFLITIPPFPNEVESHLADVYITDSLSKVQLPKGSFSNPFFGSTPTVKKPVRLAFRTVLDFRFPSPHLPGNLSVPLNTAEPQQRSGKGNVGSHNFIHFSDFVHGSREPVETNFPRLINFSKNKKERPTHHVSTPGSFIDQIPQSAPSRNSFRPLSVEVPKKWYSSSTRMIQSKKTQRGQNSNISNILEDFATRTAHTPVSFDNDVPRSPPRGKSPTKYFNPISPPKVEQLYDYHRFKNQKLIIFGKLVEPSVQVLNILNQQFPSMKFNFFKNRVSKRNLFSRMSTVKPNTPANSNPRHSDDPDSQSDLNQTLNQALDDEQSLSSELSDFETADETPNRLSSATNTSKNVNFAISRDTFIERRPVTRKIKKIQEVRSSLVISSRISKFAKVGFLDVLQTTKIQSTKPWFSASETATKIQNFGNLHKQKPPQTPSPPSPAQSMPRNPSKPRHQSATEHSFLDQAFLALSKAMHQVNEEDRLKEEEERKRKMLLAGVSDHPERLFPRSKSTPNLIGDKKKGLKHRSLSARSIKVDDEIDLYTIIHDYQRLCDLYYPESRPPTSIMASMPSSRPIFSRSSSFPSVSLPSRQSIRPQSADYNAPRPINIDLTLPSDVLYKLEQALAESEVSIDESLFDEFDEEFNSFPSRSASDNMIDSEFSSPMTSSPAYSPPQTSSAASSIISLASSLVPCSRSSFSVQSNDFDDLELEVLDHEAEMMGDVLIDLVMEEEIRIMIDDLMFERRPKTPAVERPKTSESVLTIHNLFPSPPSSVSSPSVASIPSEDDESFQEIFKSPPPVTPEIEEEVIEIESEETVVESEEQSEEVIDDVEEIIEEEEVVESKIPAFVFKKSKSEVNLHVLNDFIFQSKILFSSAPPSPRNFKIFIDSADVLSLQCPLSPEVSSSKWWSAIPGLDYLSSEEEIIEEEVVEEEPEVSEIEEVEELPSVTSSPSIYSECSSSISSISEEREPEIPSPPPLPIKNDSPKKESITKTRKQILLERDEKMWKKRMDDLINRYDWSSEVKRPELRSLDVNIPSITFPKSPFNQRLQSMAHSGRQTSSRSSVISTMDSSEDFKNNDPILDLIRSYSLRSNRRKIKKFSVI